MNDTTDDTEHGELFRTFNVGWTRSYRWRGLDQMIALTNGIDRRGNILMVKTCVSARNFADVCDGRVKMLEWAGEPEIAANVRELRDKLLTAADQAESIHE